jgi:hypothetical protein
VAGDSLTVSPGSIGTGYVIRAVSEDDDTISATGMLDVVRMEIAPAVTNVNGNASTNCMLGLANSYSGTPGATWASSPAGMANVGWNNTNFWFNPSNSIATNYLVTAGVTGYTNCMSVATVNVIRAELEELSFTNNFTIISDSGTTNYTAPHWHDPNRDGNAADGHCYPLCFTRNTKMKLSMGKWHVEPADPTVEIKIKGDGPGNLDFPEITATVSGNDVTISNVECSANFANEIDFFDPLAVDWKASIDGGTTWFAAGCNTNQTYVTLGNPSTNVALYHTLVHIGCKNADGETTADGAVDAIWPEFEDRIVKRVDGQTLYYYSNAIPMNTSVTLAGLLQTADGSCGAWAGMLRGTWTIQGIDDASIREVSSKSMYGYDNDSTPPRYITMNNQGFLIKSWVIGGTPTNTSNDTNQNWIHDVYEDAVDTNLTYEYVPGISFLRPYDDGVLDTTNWCGNTTIPTGTGIKGQGNVVPELQMFELHYLVRRGSSLYDPSYGNKYSSLLDWEDDNVVGYWQSTYWFETDTWTWQVGQDDGTLDYLEVGEYDTE